MPIIRYLTPGSKLLFLILLIILCLFFTMAIGLTLAAPFFGENFEAMLTPEGMINPASIPFQKFIQIISQIGFFIVPVLVYSRLVEGNATDYLLLRKKPKTITILITVSLFILSIPAINFLLEMNQHIQFPEYLKEFEKWINTNEKAAEDLTISFLRTSTIQGFLVNLLMLAVLPAIGEELLFRGCMTRLFFEWSRNKHIAILITSLLFTAAHMQFMGFVPRLVLGFMLGYLFVWSGNLWLPIIAHFTNNVIVVIAAFLSERGQISIDIKEFGASNSPLIIILSFIVSILLIWFIKKREFIPDPVAQNETRPSEEEEPRN